MGIVSPDAVLWERVIEPSEFAHMITICEFAMDVPKPLRTGIRA